jgi:hypothetical protein
MNAPKPRFIDTVSETEADAFGDCVRRVEDLSSQEQENVCLLMFYYWVHVVLRKMHDA